MLGRHKVLGKMLGKRGLKAEGRAGGKPDAAKIWTDFAERKGIPDRRREQIISRKASPFIVAAIADQSPSAAGAPA